MREIKPTYNPGNCSRKLFEEVNCGFARQMYARVLAKKYGIDACIEDQFDKYWIKKQLLDLNLVYDPEMCVVPECCVPCGVVAVLEIYNIYDCPIPRNISATVLWSQTECTTPTEVDAVITFQN